MNRIDLRIDAPSVTPADLSLPAPAERTREVAARVARARTLQLDRAGVLTSVLDPASLDALAASDDAGAALLAHARERLNLPARGFHRVLRFARTVADLDGEGAVRRRHLAEALGLRARIDTSPQPVS